MAPFGWKTAILPLFGVYKGQKGNVGVKDIVPKTITDDFAARIKLLQNPATIFFENFRIGKKYFFGYSPY